MRAPGVTWVHAAARSYVYTPAGGEKGRWEQAQKLQAAGESAGAHANFGRMLALVGQLVVAGGHMQDPRGRELGVLCAPPPPLLRRRRLATHSCVRSVWWSSVLVSLRGV